MTRRAGSPGRGMPLVGALALACAALTSCTSGGAGEAAPPTATASAAVVGAAASTTVGAELRAGLTFLLTERTHLAAMATRALEESGGSRDAPAVRAAADRLDANTVAVADALGAAYPGAGPTLLPPLRRLDQLLLDHVAARAAGAAPAAEQALAALPAAHRELAGDVGQVVPELPEAEVSAASAANTEALLAVTGAVAAGDPRQFALLRAANGQAPGTAALLAQGITSQRGRIPIGLPAAELRSVLTGLLAEQVLLTGALAAALADGGAAPSAPLPAAALAALDANAVALGDTVGAAYPAAALPFVTAFRARAQALVAYATALAGGQSGATQLAALESFPEQLGAVVERHVDDLPASRTAAELTPAGTSLRAAVDSAAAGDPDAADDLLRAAADVPSPAALMAAAISEDLGLR